MRIVLFAVFAILLFAGCASTASPRAAAIQEADERMVENCTFLGIFVGNSTLSGPAGRPVGIENAKISALEKAAKKDVTHIVWQDIDANYAGIAATGRGYRCEN